jgi:MFS family permease
MLDRYGPRRVLFVAALPILCGILLILLGVSAASWKPLAPYVPVVVLFVLAGVAGSGGGVIDATTNGLISSVYAQRRGSALNLFNLLYPLGGVSIALIDAGLLTAFHNDPRLPLLFTTCFTTVATLSLLGVPRGYRLQAPTHGLHNEVREPNDEVSKRQKRRARCLLP